MDWIKSAYSSISGTGTSGQTKHMNANSQANTPDCWFSGQKLLGSVGKFITSAQTGLTQTKNCFTQGGRQCAPFLRLNSQGESSCAEDELANFPVVCPKQPPDMAVHNQQQRSDPSWGWGYANQQAPMYTKPPQPPMYNNFEKTAYRTPMGNGFIPYGYPNLNPGYSSVPMQCPDPRRMPQQWTWPQPEPLTWLPHIPYCQYNHPPPPVSHAPWNNNVFQFRGNYHDGYRDPRYVNQHTHRHPKRNSQGRSPNPANHRTHSPKVHRHVRKDAHSNKSFQVKNNTPNESADVINKMSELSISAQEKACDKSANNSSVSEQTVQDLPSDTLLLPCENNSNNTSQEITGEPEKTSSCDKKPSEKSVSSCQSPTILKKSNERIDDRFLAIELCCSPNSNVDASRTEVKLKSDIKSGSPKAPVQETCIMLTPKISCLTQTGSSRKKKTRPSSKKRRRQKLQRCAEDQIIQLTRQNKKQKTDDSTGSKARAQRCDSMSFVIDFSESDISEAENLLGSSPVISTSPLAKFSLFISGADLSDDETSDEDFSNSDSDFYEEFCDLPATPKAPFSFQIHCFSSPTTTTNKEPASEDEVDGCMAPELTSNTQSEEPNEVITEANSRWVETYGSVPLSSSSKRGKVHFPSDMSIASIHTLGPDEVAAYHEARKGKWEEYARDRERFRKRIEEVEGSIGYCLAPEHRAKILQHHS